MEKALHTVYRSLPWGIRRTVLFGGLVIQAVCRLVSTSIHSARRSASWAQRRKSVFLRPHRCFRLVVIILTLFPSIAFSDMGINKHIVSGGYIVKSDSETLSHNPHQLLIPASIIKIVTSLVALETLGPDYRFETHIYLDSDNNLFIKGFGDPYLTSDALLDIGKQLLTLGISEINKIYLDDSAFSLNGEKASPVLTPNPYDAPNGSLAVNFNSLPIFVTQEGSILSGEPETPYIPLMGVAGKDLAPGNHRINTGILPSLNEIAPILCYTGELILEQFKRAGIIINDGFAQKNISNNYEPIYIHKCIKPLTEVVRGCLKYSNNFIANQLFLSSGMAVLGQPATWDKSRTYISEYLQRRMSDQHTEIIIHEGSGLSRKNRISPAALLTVLEHFEKYSSLLEHRDQLLIKSGTLNDVFCYAGYYNMKNSLIPFVIMLNQQDNKRDLLLRQLFTHLSNKGE